MITSKHRNQNVQIMMTAHIYNKVFLIYRSRFRGDVKKPSTLIIFIAKRGRGGSYINAGLMDDRLKTSIDLDPAREQQSHFPERDNIGCCTSTSTLSSSRWSPQFGWKETIFEAIPLTHLHRLIKPPRIPLTQILIDSGLNNVERFGEEIHRKNCKTGCFFN